MPAIDEGLTERTKSGWDAPADCETPAFELAGWIAPAPFEELCGIEIEHAEEGRAELSMEFTVKLSMGAAFMHGGAITTLADTAAAMAIKSLLPAGSRFVTKELTTSFHAPVRRGRARCVARIESFENGRIDIVAEVTAGNEKAADFTAVFKLLDVPASGDEVRG